MPTKRDEEIERSRALMRDRQNDFVPPIVISEPPSDPVATEDRKPEERPVDR